MEASGLFANPGPTSFMQVIGPIVKALGEPETASRPDPPARTHRSRTHLSQQDMDDLVAGYKSGATTKELSAIFGIHHHTVSIYLKRRGVALRYKVMRPEQIALARQLYESGLSLAKVADQLGPSHNTIRAELLVAAGVEMRDSHGRQR